MHGLDMPGQLRIYELETFTRVPRKVGSGCGGVVRGWWGGGEALGCTALREGVEAHICDGL